MSDQVHVPVMVEECLQALMVENGGTYLDLTMGAGGHAEAALMRSDRARWLGVDRDAEILEIAHQRLARFGERVMLVQSRWGDLEQVLDERQIDAVDGALLDLGVSSLQLDRAERGFAFSKDGPLDMRLDPKSGDASAADLLQRTSQEQLEKWIRTFGEERFAGRIARTIVETRRKQPLRRTGELARIIEEVVPGPPKGTRRRIHPATRTFQALRIVVNGELEDIERALGILQRRIKPGGRLVVLSYHSLEDRIVKRFLRQAEQQQLFRRVNKKPFIPTAAEIDSNPRSRSAKLRIGERTTPLGGR